MQWCFRLGAPTNTRTLDRLQARRAHPLSSRVPSSGPSSTKRLLELLGWQHCHPAACDSRCHWQSSLRLDLQQHRTTRYLLRCTTGRFVREQSRKYVLPSDILLCQHLFQEKHWYTSCGEAITRSDRPSEGSNSWREEGWVEVTILGYTGMADVFEESCLAGLARRER